MSQYLDTLLHIYPGQLTDSQTTEKECIRVSERHTLVVFTSHVIYRNMSLTFTSVNYQPGGARQKRLRAGRLENKKEPGA